jgi:hypothetical protein
MTGLVVEGEMRRGLTRASAPAPDLLGGSGPTRQKDAGRGAGAPDALLGRELLCGEVP